MGLDMYLTRKTYISSYDDEWVITIKKNGKLTSIDPKKISSIEEDVGYWRKANAIHKWFVHNVQDGKDDCGTYYVSESKLRELMDTCYQVMDNPSRAPELLPTANGFFFGSIDYGEQYMDDIGQTINILQKTLEIQERDKMGTIYYHSSW